MEESKIVNPLTGRLIKIGGTTYNNLVKDGYIRETPTSPLEVAGIDALDKIKLIIREEEAEMKSECDKCKILISRQSKLQGFSVPEITSLRSLIKSCNRCGELCDVKEARKGITNSKACSPYKKAELIGKASLDRLDTKQRMAGINAARASDFDASVFFPKVPK